MAIVDTGDASVWINRHQTTASDDAVRAAEENADDDGSCKVLSSTKERRVVSSR
jgi:hypothetical protein